MVDEKWGTPSKVYFSDKPLLEGTTDLQSVDRNEFEIEVDCPRVVPFEDIFTQEPSECAYTLEDFARTSWTIDVTIKPKQMRELRKMLRIPKLPRKLKKYVKKTYFDVYPKRMSRYMLNFAFAINNQMKAGKVGLYIGVDVAKGEDTGNEI